jgi:regulator of protease activity HflC (stomatin/prohibitin superfamily)
MPNLAVILVVATNLVAPLDAINDLLTPACLAVLGLHHWGIIPTAATSWAATTFETGTFHMARLNKDVLSSFSPSSIAGSGIVVLLMLFLFGWLLYTPFRISVPTGSMAVLIKKTGKNIPNSDEVAPDETYKGVQRDVLTEGRYFRNPYLWEWRVIEQIEIPDGKLGVLVSLVGKDLPYGAFLAELDAEGKPLTKGIIAEVLRPGRYPINPYMFQVEMHDPVTVPAGYRGVVTNLAGPFPKNPNRLLVEEGERGVQPTSLDAGTYYVNPYVTNISLVDCRSQRFNLAENKDMGFPSKDGFWVSLDGAIEFRVAPDKVAEVYVTYNDDANGPLIDEEIISKVIMPNARSYCRLQGSNELGREFISGDTRKIFQEHFQTEMRDACEPLGVEIIQALITRIYPPQQIAEPVRKREIAKQQEKQYHEQIEQQLAEQQVAVENELILQRQALVGADQTVVRLTTEAEQKQEVGVTMANQRLAVAELALEAAADKVAAILSRGKAEADVVAFQNQAEAAGWERAVKAFNGNGMQYANYVLFEKLSGAYRNIMINTADSPLMKIFEPHNDADPPKAAPAEQKP